MSTPQELSPLHERLLAATGNRTYRCIADLTGTHPETVRRYLQGQSPSSEFITAICSALELNGQWLLSGEGPMKAADAKYHALRHSDPSELLIAIAGTLDALTERLTRLEQFADRLEHHTGRATLSSSPSDSTDPIDQQVEHAARENEPTQASSKAYFRLAALSRAAS